LYDEKTNEITWEDYFYIGETQTEMKSGATITGRNPYEGSTGEATAVELGCLYTYESTGWNEDPKRSPSEKYFAIENQPGKTNNFYVSQSQAGTYIVVQNIPGSGGTGTFEPLEKVAIILTGLPYDAGTLITQTFSPGVIGMLSGESPTLDISYNKDTGWAGRSSQIERISAVNSIYDAMLKATAGGPGSY